MVISIREFGNTFFGFVSIQEPKHTELLDAAKERGLVPDDLASQIRRRNRAEKADPSLKVGRLKKASNKQSNSLISRIYTTYIRNPAAGKVGPVCHRVNQRYNSHKG